MFQRYFKILAALAALCLGLSSNADQGLPPSTDKTRILTIDEVVRMALTNNLDILMSRLTPEIDQFALNGLYGAYEPSLSMSVVHNYDSLPSGVFTGAGLDAFGATVEKIDSYNVGLSGTLPTGLTYNFTGPF
jgi:hypothetical protein